MKQLEAMYAWNPGSTRIAIGPWPDTKGWSRSYQMTGGACYSSLHQADAATRLAQLFIDFHTIVVGDGVDPMAAHRAFLAIDEFRAAISPDIEGADA